MAHAPSGSIVVVELTARPKPSLTVADRGPGIPAEERAGVVRRFVRLDASRSRPGAGLGLSLVNAVARMHGAVFELTDNAPGLRATLRFGESAPAGEAEGAGVPAPDNAPRSVERRPSESEA